MGDVLTGSADFGNLAPREKIFARGVHELLDYELISVVLGSGTSKKSVYLLAKEVEQYLKQCKDEPVLLDLERIGGLGRVKACQVLACLELSGRFLLGCGGQAITNPRQLVPLLAFLKQKTQENMICITLNGANRVMNTHTLTVGLVNQTQIHPREAFRKAVQDGAVSVVFAHNHPSGTLHASPEDIMITRRLIESGRILDIPVLDHIIISSEGWVSIKASHPAMFSL